MDMCGIMCGCDGICVGYVCEYMWCGYVWDMCGARYANNLLKNPATKRSFGKNVLFTSQVENMFTYTALLQFFVDGCVSSCVATGDRQGDKPCCG